ncbi:MAG TPA: DUF4105 domain-containing protein [Polyangiaceae bacterium]|nr:DUF4105 domain-containing protein [Polyangiaceae bacterium]
MLTRWAMIRTTRAFSGGPGRAVFRGAGAGGGRAGRGGAARRAKAALAALLLALAALAAAPAPARAAEPGDELTISVLTFGPGDHPFFKFGHNALLVHDERQRRDVVYNFGAFRFDSPWLLIDFFQGRLKYWLATRSLTGTIGDYRREGRSIEAQELELTPAQRLAISEALQVNAREENKYYKYDYYRDNCSTRVRDAVDRVVGGKLREVSRGPAEMSWRDHTRRLVADDLPVYLGLHVAMGDLIDKPIDVWQEMFLPSKLQETLRKARVPTPQGERPLVKSEKTLLAADRGPLRPAPPRWLLPMLAAGVALGGTFYGLAHLGRRRPAARVAFGSLAALLGLVLGFLGTLFFFFWTLTDHEVAYRNENMLQCAPWALALVVVGVGVARGRPAWLRRGRLLGLSLVGASALGLVLKVLPWFDQNNAEIIALALPLWAGVAAGLVALERALAAPGLAPALAGAGGAHDVGAGETATAAGEGAPARAETEGAPAKGPAPAERGDVPTGNALAEKGDMPALRLVPTEKSEASAGEAFPVGAGATSAGDAASAATGAASAIGAPTEAGAALVNGALAEAGAAPAGGAPAEAGAAPAGGAPAERGAAPATRVSAPRGTAAMGKPPAVKGEVWVSHALAGRGEASRAKASTEPGRALAGEPAPVAGEAPVGAGDGAAGSESR